MVRPIQFSSESLARLQSIPRMCSRSAEISYFRPFDLPNAESKLDQESECDPKHHTST